MTENPPTTRRLSTSGELIVGALLGAILGWPITRALDGWASESKLPWWTYLVGAAIGIGIVLFLMTFIIKAWRRSVWGSVGRAFAWFWSLRPVSRRRYDSDRTELQSWMDKTGRDLLTNLELLDEPRGQTKVHIDTSANLKTPTLPLPPPRWRIQRDKTDSNDETFTLINSVERSVAREVRVDDSHDFNGEPNGVATILDGGHFEDLSGKESGEFRAQFSQSARYDGGGLDVTWYDEKAEKQHEYVHVSGWKSRPSPADTWNRPNILDPNETPF